MSQSQIGQMGNCWKGQRVHEKVSYGGWVEFGTYLQYNI